MGPKEFTVDTPGKLFGIVKFATSQRLNGYDEKGNLRCIFNFSEKLIITNGPRGGNRTRRSMRDYVYKGSVLDHVWLITLRWRPVGGWDGSPLELLALCDLQSDGEE